MNNKDIELKKTKEFSGVLLPVADLLEQKNHDYGRSYDVLREEYGEVSFLIRLGDKVNRLKTLVKHPAKVKAEAVEDTIKDIIGYCTLELCFRKNKGVSINQNKCRVCRYVVLTQADLFVLDGYDPCDNCQESCNWAEV
ncbi:nucleotide modification associated domain-containing protein [Desulfosporosinus sp. Sb-LF]|uniref:nucleotide modification associated domain-containing protein n=1 Tax=Desulfosporosinus sp. Sb-LF TaxID=2560027 RepID=UPI00107FD032|nr:nucleotide modification associated domain-containing protein [Desulfosporosinus sp. Sb-LF]TGE31313.1 DUF1599 domain-containing protein [Desulfosporosinus sp. Sb-LF]